MQRQAPGAPRGADPVLLHRQSNVRFDLGGVSADARLAGLADFRVGRIYLLHHRAHQTGEFGDFSFEDGFAEIDIAQDPVERVAVPVVWRRLEKTPRDLGPVICRGDRQSVLALEVMEERALRDAGLRAEFIDGSRRIALLADQRQGGIQQPLAGPDFFRLRRTSGFHPWTVPTSRYVCLALLDELLQIRLDPRNNTVPIPMPFLPVETGRGVPRTVRSIQHPAP